MWECLTESDPLLDVSLLDRAVFDLYSSGTSPIERHQIDRALSGFRHRSDIPSLIRPFLGSNVSVQTKFLALVSLQNFVTISWFALPPAIDLNCGHICGIISNPCHLLLTPQL
jgi:hypothetical protein